MPASQRESWPDVAKGGAILLVVLFHASLFLDDVGLASMWGDAVVALDTFRMPVFFFVAGLFAAKALALDLRSLIRRRVLSLLWLYVLWSVIWTVAFQFLPLLREVPTWTELALLFVWPNASTWFVYSLALYFVLAWAMRALPVAVQLSLAAGLSVVFSAGVVETGNTALDKMGQCFVFFLGAALLGPRVRAAAARTRPVHALLWGLAYTATTAVAAVVDGFRVPGVRLLVSVLAIAFGIALAVWLTGRRQFRWLEALGRQTLPVYVLHYYPILVLCALLEPVAPLLEPLAPVLPLAFTALATVFALGAARVTRGVPGLYGLPARSPQAVARRAPARVG